MATTRTGRIYAVTPKTAAEPATTEPNERKPATRLIDAPNPAQALKHVASDFTVEIASSRQVAELVRAGVEVEVAGAEPTTTGGQAQP